MNEEKVNRIVNWSIAAMIVLFLLTLLADLYFRPPVCEPDARGEVECV